MLENVEQEKLAAIKIVSKSGNELRNLSSELRDCDKVVYEAILNSPVSIEHASYRLRNDLEMVSVAVSLDPNALRYVGLNMMDNESIMLLAAQKNPWVYSLASKRIKGSKAIAKLFVKLNGAVLELMSDEMKNNIDIVKSAINNTSLAEKYVGKDILELKNKYNTNSILYAIDKELGAFAHSVNKLN